jgi:polyisoprenoid-binding protein YceI
MKKNICPFTALLIIAASAFTFIQSQNWKIGEDYSIKFSGNNASGIFKGLKGTVDFDDANLASSKFDVTVDVATINTGNGMKNTHAKSDKWFDAEKYPTITFVSTSITKSATGYDEKGNL